MSNYTEIHAKNSTAYAAITAAPDYMSALAESGKHGDTYEIRKLYAKFILGNRIRPVTKAQISGRFAEAWETAKEAAGDPITMGDLRGGLTPRHTRVKA